MSNELENYSKRTVNCPHCSGEIVVVVDYKLSALDPAKIYNEQQHGDFGEFWKKSLSVEDRSIVDSAETNGLIEPFARAFEKAHGQSLTRPHKAFLSWIKEAKPQPLPREVLDYFAAEYGGRIHFIARQSVGAVLSDGRFEEFYPTEFTSGKKIGGKFRVTNASIVQVIDWRRTKYGYVASRGAFYEMINKKNIGEFARPGM